MTAPDFAAHRYDAILVLSFGGPDKPDDVMPFLENVLRGRNVPRERMLEVAEHYYHFGGKSPINEQNLALIDALRALLAEQGPALPVYWGNRNWHPMLTDTVRQMRDDGVRRAITFVTSAYSSYSGCRQYRENIAQAQETVGADAPQFDKLRVFFNHPGFVEPVADLLRQALDQIPEADRATTPILFTAHSVPMSMVQPGRYVDQLNEAVRLVSEAVGRPDGKLVYQSRSGAPGQPWLEPDVLESIREVHAATGTKHLVLSPIGFISDHMEVLYDLDTEAMELCAELGIHMVRAGTVGIDARFIAMIRELVLERMGEMPKRALGLMPANHDVCPVDCCPAPARPVAIRPVVGTAQ